MKKLICVFCVVLGSGSVDAQKPSVILSPSLDDILSSKYNPYGKDAKTPVYLLSEPVSHLITAEGAYQMASGNYSKADRTPRENLLHIGIDGKKKVKQCQLYGYLNYQNIQGKDSRWGSALYLDPLNPFLIADSIAGKRSVEQFSLGAAVAFPFKHFRIGARADMTIGSMSDETDPRPKNQATKIALLPSVEYILSENKKIGLTLGADFMSSRLNYSVVNTYKNNTFFIMKGLGDYMAVTTQDNPSYPRDYKGQVWHAHAHYLTENSGRDISNFSEISFYRHGEWASDGGSSYLFKGGDFTGYDIGLYDRFRFTDRCETVHTFSLRGLYRSGNGDWYDQKKHTDPEHGNLTYYEVLSKNRIHQVHMLSADLEYAVFPNWIKQGASQFSGRVAFHQQQADQFAEANYHQAYRWLEGQVKGQVEKSLKQWQCYAMLTVAYRQSLGNTDRQCFDNDLGRDYTNAILDFETAKQVQLGAELSAGRLVRIVGNPLLATLFASHQTVFYPQESVVAGAHKSFRYRSQTQIGLRLSF